MIEVIESEVFTAWLGRLRDPVGRAAILRRLRQLQADVWGDVKSVGGGVSELRISVGPGYRVYFKRRGATMVLLLCGGDKGSQTRDIARARRMAEQL